MNELVKIHIFYSLNAFVVVFLKGIEDVQVAGAASFPATSTCAARFRDRAPTVVRRRPSTSPRRRRRRAGSVALQEGREEGGEDDFPGARHPERGLPRQGST